MALEGLIKLKEKFVRRASRKFPDKDKCTFEEFKEFIHTSMGIEFDEEFLKECYDEFKVKVDDENNISIF